TGARRGAGGALMFVRRTVLLADDDCTAREQLRGPFQYAGLTLVGEARNTDDALDKFERLEPELVVMDVMLLGTLDALVAIKQMRRSPRGVLILATGTASQNATLMEALTMGATDFLTKPFQERTVRNCLEQNL